jgi:hypothetical protein
VFARAAFGFLLVSIVAFSLLPEAPPDATKSVREAQGVYAALFGLGGFAIGGFAGSWAAKVLSRRLAK